MSLRFRLALALALLAAASIMSVMLLTTSCISTLLVPPYPRQLKENAEWLAPTTQH